MFVLIISVTSWAQPRIKNDNLQVDPSHRLSHATNGRAILLKTSFIQFEELQQTGGYYLYTAISFPATKFKNGYIGAREGSAVKNILLLKKTRVQFPVLTSDSSQLPVTTALGKSKASNRCLHSHVHSTH